MDFRARPAVPPKPRDLSTPRPSIPHPPPIMKSLSVAKVKPPAMVRRVPAGGSDGELEQMKVFHPAGGLGAPVMPTTRNSDTDGEASSEQDGVDLSKDAQMSKLQRDKGNKETKNNFQPPVSSINSSSTKRNSCSIKNISLQAKFNSKRPFAYKAMNSPETGDVTRRRSESTPNTALQVKRSSPVRPNVTKTPKKVISTRTQSSPLEASLNTTPKIIAATLKNGQEIHFTSPIRGCDSVDGGVRAPPSTKTPDSPRSKGMQSSAKRLLIKTPLQSADANYFRPPCPFSPTDQIDLKSKPLEDTRSCDASLDKLERRDSAQSHHDQQIQELNSFVSLSNKSTPFSSPTASKSNLVNADVDEPEEVYLRTTPKQNVETPLEIKRLSSIRGPINKMRDSLKNALSNPCTSAGLQPSPSWKQLPNPSPEKTTPPSHESNACRSPSSKRVELRSTASQTLPTDMVANEANRSKSHGRLRRLWTALIDAIRKGLRRLQQAFIKLFKHQKN